MAKPKKPHGQEGGHPQIALGALLGGGSNGANPGDYKMTGGQASDTMNTTGENGPVTSADPSSQTPYRAIDDRGFFQRLLGRPNTAAQINQQLDLGQGLTQQQLGLQTALNKQLFPQQTSIQQLANQGQLDVTKQTGQNQLATGQQSAENQQKQAFVDAYLKEIAAGKTHERAMAEADATSQRTILGAQGIPNTPENAQNYQESIVPNLQSIMAGKTGMQKKYYNDPASYDPLKTGLDYAAKMPQAEFWKTGTTVVPPNNVGFQAEGGLLPGRTENQSMTNYKQVLKPDGTTGMAPTSIEAKNVGPVQPAITPIPAPANVNPNPPNSDNRLGQIIGSTVQPQNQQPSLQSLLGMFNRNPAAGGATDPTQPPQLPVSGQPQQQNVLQPLFDYFMRRQSQPTTY